MTTAKRQTITDFLKHSLCEGQSEIGPIGYSPLPVNLVQAGFTQVNKLKKADSKVSFDSSIIQNVKNCHNPTFVPGKPNQNYLAKIAPFPAECDRPGKGPCAAGVGAINDNPNADGSAPKGAAGSDATPDAGTTGDGAAAANGAAPDAATTPQQGAVSPVATTVAADAHSGPSPVLTTLVVGLLLGALVVPPVVSQLVRRPGGGR